jgi:hypothetical protein
MIAFFSLEARQSDGSVYRLAFGAGIQAAAVIEGGFDRVAGVEGWPVRRCRVRRGCSRAMPADGPADTHSALRRTLGLVMTYRSGWRLGVAAAGGGVSRRA